MAQLLFNDLLFATHNAGKRAELAYMLAPLIGKLHDLSHFTAHAICETGSSFEENAELKARYGQSLCPYPVLADDSGLLIEVLDDAPGLYTADWALSEDGQRDYALAIERIYREMQRRDAFARNLTKARFISVFCLIWQDKSYFFRGEVVGDIICPPQGDKGFGYDPIFRPLNYDKSFGQMANWEKFYGASAYDLAKSEHYSLLYDDKAQLLSHRAKALKELVSFLKKAQA